MTRALHGFVLAACAACGFDDAGSGDDGGSDAGGGDGPIGCQTFIAFDPMQPIAGPSTVVRADANVFGAPGVLGYHWSVAYGGAPIATDFAQADQSAITFPAVAAGIYRVRLTVDSALACPDAQVDFNVLAEGANMSQVRLHVTPPASASTPPLDKLVPVPGGAPFSIGNVVLDPGVIASEQVRHGAIGVGAYLRFMPAGAKEAAVETFANPLTGMFSVRVLNQPHDVLVVPTSATVAPRIVEDWTPGMALVLGDSTPVTGTLRAASGAGLAGAKVQLALDGVPSTLATTSATGAFTVHVVPKPGASIAVDVTPPAGSGLPRLAAASTAFVLDQPVLIAYSTLALRDIGGATIRRGGNAVANAKLTLVGSLSAAGTVSTGGAPVTATGTVRVAATANAGGVVPATLAPARELAAVVETSLNSYAVSSVDLTASAPSTIDAPAPQQITTRIRRPDQTGIAGVALDVVPVGALALAGASGHRVVSVANGQLVTSLAAGGHYELRFDDPSARGAPLIVPDVTAPMVVAAYTLRTGLLVSGTLVQPSTQPIPGASVQILCSLCTGIERDRPLAEVTSGPAGAFALVVPDPGTM